MKKTARLRHTLLFLLPAVLGAQAGAGSSQNAAEAAPTAAVEGKVLDASTGQPVRNASLVLRPTTAGNGAASAAATDNEGAFAFKAIAAGTYRLTAARSGYLEAEYGARRPGGAGSTFTLSQDQTLRSVVLRMYRQGIISGQVVDDSGDPVEHVRVGALRYQYVNRERQLMPEGTADTDDQGSYRIFGLTPGRYVIRAQPPAGAAEYAYLAAYYPNTSDENLAAPVELAAGNQLPGINFTLTKSRVLRMHVQVRNQTGIQGAIMVMAAARTGLPMPGAMRINPVDASGSLDLKGFPPGAYILMAGMTDKNQIYCGRLDIDVADRNLDNLVLPLLPATEVTGEIKVEDDAPVDLSSLSVALRSFNSVRAVGLTAGEPIAFGTNVTEKVAGDRTFVLRGIFPDSPNLFISRMPDGFYVQAITLNERDVLDSGFDFYRAPGTAMRITLSGKAGTVQGSVVDDDDHPVATATVVMIPKLDTHRALPQSFKTAITSPQGQFIIKNVEPGDYRVFAWEDVESGAWTDPDFVRTYNSMATELTVDPSGHPQVKLTRIPAGK